MGIAGLALAFRSQIAGRIFTLQIVLSLRRQNSYNPTFKMCSSTSQLKYYRKVFRSCMRKSMGCSQLAQQLRRKEAQTSPPAFSGVEDPHIWEPTAFTAMLSSPANLRIFPF